MSIRLSLTDQLEQVESEIKGGLLDELRGLDATTRASSLARSLAVPGIEAGGRRRKTAAAAVTEQQQSPPHLE